MLYFIKVALNNQLCNPYKGKHNARWVRKALGSVVRYTASQTAGSVFGSFDYYINFVKIVLNTKKYTLTIVSRRWKLQPMTTGFVNRYTFRLLNCSKL